MLWAPDAADHMGRFSEMPPNLIGNSHHGFLRLCRETVTVWCVVLAAFALEFIPVEEFDLIPEDACRFLFVTDRIVGHIRHLEHIIGNRMAQSFIRFRSAVAVHLNAQEIFLKGLACDL